MNDNRRHITVVLDRSGSMQRVRADTEGGLNGFIEDQTKVTEELGKVTTVTLIEFNHSVNPVYRNKGIQRVEPYELHPSGSTALFDAIGYGILDLDEHLAKLPENDRPAEIVFVILTDGHNNASFEHTMGEVKELITKHTEAGWQFIFLGADQDAFVAGGRMGIAGGNTVSYDSRSATRTSWSVASDMVSRGTRTGDYSVTDEERFNLTEKPTQ